MDLVQQSLVDRAYATPTLRQNILNRGMMFFYCDYSGHDDRKEGGLACCFVHNKAIRVTARRIDLEDPGDSVYGELQAVLFSLERLGEAVGLHRPKGAVIFTDYSRIAKLFDTVYVSKPRYQGIRDQIAAVLEELQIRHPDIKVSITYISKHKKNNALHHMAHLAARKAIGK